MSDTDSQPRSRGCLARIFSLFLFFAAIGLCVALYEVSQPQDLSDIQGYGTVMARDLKTALANAVDRGYPLTLTEADLNAWLKQTLSVKQGGLFGEQVKLEGVAVRLDKDLAEVILDRSVFGRRFTVSMFLQIEQTESANGVATVLHRDGGPYQKDFPKFKKGGRFGKLVVPQGLLLLVMPSFKELSEQFPEEIKLGFERMARVTIEENGITLDPRAPAEKITPGTF
jgi:hypothetical protein